MPLKPPALRFLRSPFPITRFASMSFHNSSIKQPSGPSVPILSRIFPFRLKHQSLGLGFPPSPSLSTRSEVQAGSKSLIEDEDELDSWVTRLRTSSIRSGALTEDEEEAERGGVTRKRGRGSESNFDSDDNGDDGFGRKGIRDSYTSAAPSSRNSPRGGARGGMNMRGRDQLGTRGGGRIGGRGDGLDYNRGGRGGMNMKGREREFGSRDQPGRGLGRGSGTISRGGGRMGGRGENIVKRRAPVRLSEEDEDEDEGPGSRGEKKKSVSDFVSLIAEEDSDEDIGDDEDEHEIKSRTALFANVVQKQSSSSVSTGATDAYLSETRFDQCTVSPASLKAIKDAGYEKMTMVQEATLPLILQGKDVMAKARTGTGKTVAFLLPSIEVVVNSERAGRDQKLPPILVLVICPTRELASQAASEANKLLKYHPSIGVQVVIGGTRLAVEQKHIQANPCQILVATPGRLRDHLENTSGFATRVMGVKVLVLDEADHLLDMGFRKDIERIIAAVPKQRQTLLFSATISNEVRQISHIALKRDHEYVNTVVEGSGETHAQVRQTHLIAPLENQFSLLYALLKEHISDDVNYKVLVFCTTAMITRLVANLLGELNLNVREIHSRKPQNYRTRVSDEFRKSKGLILVTSDVSARGVDYPDVTLVIQMGLPSDREQYIHRLGRTGRKGKEGQGILMLAPWEEKFLNSIKDIPISKATAPMVDPDTRKKVERALSNVEMKNKEAAYQAWLGYYNSNKIVGKDKFRLVELANEFSRTMGLDTPPAITKKILGLMGLKNMPGLRSK